MRHSAEETQAFRAESLHRATTGTSLANYGVILEGFLAMGIPITEILPRENVLTFNAWKALGRSVTKGQHGVKVISMIEKEHDGALEKLFVSATVFHISQTKKEGDA